MFRGRIRSIHFVGIGGVGMSGIAEVLIDHGFRVSGSDLRLSETIERLREKGAHIVLDHLESNVEGADVVVFSSAVTPQNPELIAAHRQHIPVIPRAEMLGELMRLKDGIAIAGSHGKTTTTSLVATVLRHAELDPTVVIGGKLNALGSGATRGVGSLLVAEADESDGSFLYLTPTIAVITHIDAEHLDHYGDLDSVKQAFVGFANRVPFFGAVIACIDHPHVQDILPQISRRTITYGLSKQADYTARNVAIEGLCSRFEVSVPEGPLGEFSVRLPGYHHVRNALATLAVADELEISRDLTRTALSDFSGVQRRFSSVGSASDVHIIDDYGHHPSEIEATLEAAKRAFPKRVVAIFQPHRYSRTQLLFQDFTRAFNDADLLFVTDIYAAGESPIPDLSAQTLVDAIRAHGHGHVHYLPMHDSDWTAAVHAQLRPGDCVMTLGAGNITQRGPELLDCLHQRPLAVNP